jgi:hypothetical protein
VKRNYLLIVLCLLISLFIYLFYRTEKTVINEIFTWLIPYDNLSALRHSVTAALPLNEHVVFSLPEGLWVFCITLTSKPFFMQIAKYEFDLIYLPLVFSIGLELLQLFHFTNGRFDFWDIGLSIFFWMLANYLIKNINTRQNIFQPFTIHSLICVLSFLIVYLAHSWR